MTLESLGLNMGLVVAINIVIEGIKKWDKTGKLKKITVFLPLILAFPVGLLVTDWGKNGAAFTQSYLVNVVLYAALSGYAFKLVQGAASLASKSAPVAPVAGTPPVAPAAPVAVAVDVSATEKAQGK